MWTSLYDLAARRKTISITVNGDLVAKASAAGINLSRTAEEAIAKAFTDLERKLIAEELRDAVARVDAYVALHGRPFDDWTGETEDLADDAA